MADWSASIELPLLTGEDWAWAQETTKLHLGLVREGKQRDQRAVKFWTDYEMDLYGYLGEASFAKYAGFSLPEPSIIATRPDGGRDFGPYQVKTAPWRRLEDFHLCHGGRLITALTHLRSDLLYVRQSFFLKSRRCWLDGWADGEMMPAARRLTSNAGKPARELSYTALRPASTLL